ncbi:MAG: sigma-70 family RNA polymerase sigma factor [Nocardioidaceae bacterium]|nr:sigma-70 family RNA polymerase sigma factor [Nocardioidaceae bacterium]
MRVSPAAREAERRAPADGALVDRARDGDAAAWAQLYRAHAGRLVAWLAHLTSPDVAASAEDLAAEAWLTAAEKVHEFRGDDDAFAGWLFGIARHHAQNARRRSARRGTSPVGQVEDALGDTAILHALEADVVADQWIHQALASLPTREREVIACIDVVGLDVAGTATALDISQVAVRVARHRGLARLRRTTLDG